MPRAVCASLELQESGCSLNLFRANAGLGLASISQVDATKRFASPPTSAIAPRPGRHQSGWNAASLFSGCGGLDLGFASAGVETTQAYDKSTDAVTAFNANQIPVAQTADLSAYLPRMERADVLLAGAPCQGFSTNGRRELYDRRNMLLGAIDAACAVIRPKVLIAENVPAALSGSHAFHWLSLEARLASLGYNVRRVMVEAEEHGIAQHRKRLILIAWIGSDCIQVKLPTRPALTLQEALAEIAACEDHCPRLLAPESLPGRIAKRIGRGQKLSNVRLGARNIATWDIPEVFGETTASEREVLVAVSRLRRRQRSRKFGDGDPVAPRLISEEVGFDSREAIKSLIARDYLREINGGIEHKNTYNGKYRRLDWQTTSPTVDTRYADPRLFLHPDEHRGFTLREAMRIQGFPDWFRVTGSQRARFELVGNAVPPPLSADLAAFVRDALLKA